MVLQWEWAEPEASVRYPDHMEFPAVLAVPEYCRLEYLAHCTHVMLVAVLAAMEGMHHENRLEVEEVVDIQCLDLNLDTEDMLDRHSWYLLGLREVGNNCHMHLGNILAWQAAWLFAEAEVLL